MDEDAVERMALEIWRARELGFPERARRMIPDALDFANGNWRRVMEMARQRLDAAPQREPASLARDD